MVIETSCVAIVAMANNGRDKSVLPAADCKPLKFALFTRRRVITDAADETAVDNTVNAIPNKEASATFKPAENTKYRPPKPKSMPAILIGVNLLSGSIIAEKMPVNSGDKPNNTAIQPDGICCAAK